MYSFEAQLKEQSEDASKREVAIQSTLGGIISCLKERVTLLANQTVTTPVGIGKFLKLSPDSMDKVTQYSGRGIFQTTTLRHATPTAKRSGFLVNVVNCLRPIIQKICEIPKFRDGRTDATGVCELVLASMRKNKVERITTNKRGGVTVVSVSSTRKRKLFVNADDRTPESRKRCKQSLSLPLTGQRTPPNSYPPEKKRKITVEGNAGTPPQMMQIQQPPVTVVGKVVTPPQRIQLPQPPATVVGKVATPPQRMQLTQPPATVVDNVVTPPQSDQKPPDTVVTVVGTWAGSVTLLSDSLTSYLIRNVPKCRNRITRMRK